MKAGRKRKPIAESKTQLVSAFVDVPTKAALDDLSRQEDCSISRIVRLAIEQYLERSRAGAAA